MVAEAGTAGTEEEGPEETVVETEEMVVVEMEKEETAPLAAALVLSMEAAASIGTPLSSISRCLLL
jgi:hypothetical protein